MSPDSRTISQAPSPFAPELDDDVVIEVNGTSLRGWKKIDITRRLDAVSGSFALETQHGEPWPVSAGDEVRVLVGDDLVMTGFVDEMTGEIKLDSTDLEVAGRDRTADLVDSAIPETPTELHNVSLIELARHCATPLLVDVVDELPELFRFPSFKFNTSEKCWAAIERACRTRNKIAFTDERGRLLLTTPALHDADAPIVYGQNLLGARMQWTHTDRFQTYVVKGQRPGSDDGWGAVASTVRAEARDLSVERPRVFIQIADGVVDDRSAQAYANWLSTFRAARSASVTVELLDWRQTAGGRLWKVNELVRLSIPRWRLNDKPFLVNAVRFSYPSRKTTLELVRPDAYTAEPTLEQKSDPFNAWGDDAQVPEGDDLESLEFDE